MEPKQILDLPMAANDAEAATVRDYLKELLRSIWLEGEGFSGKRPFGNSGWEHEVYAAIAQAGLIQAKQDECGYWDFSAAEQRKAHELVRQAIEVLQ